jgi:hypothetical protein
MIRAIILAAAAIALTGCATSTPPYRPAPSASAAGYSEMQVENNRYFVTYRAGGATDAALVHDLALLRAADLTLQNGHDWFRVDRRTFDEQDRYRSGPSVGVGIGGASFGGNSAIGTSVGFNFPLGGGGQRARSATLEIRLGEGPKPDDANVYDARGIGAAMRTRLAPSP